MEELSADEVSRRGRGLRGRPVPAGRGRRAVPGPSPHRRGVAEALGLCPVSALGVFRAVPELPPPSRLVGLNFFSWLIVRSLFPSGR